MTSQVIERFYTQAEVDGLLSRIAVLESELKKKKMPQRNYSDPAMDRCQTPPYAWWPLKKYIHSRLRILEPCMGEGFLAFEMAETHQVTANDLLTGWDYLKREYNPHYYDVMVTNPPYSVKKKMAFIARACELGKPWAMLMQATTDSSIQAQKWFKEYHVQKIILSRRVDFKMPSVGWDSCAQFPVAWFTCGLNLPRDVVYEDIPLEWKEAWRVENGLPPKRQKKKKEDQVMET